MLSKMIYCAVLLLLWHDVSVIVFGSGLARLPFLGISTHNIKLIIQQGLYIQNEIAEVRTLGQFLNRLHKFYIIQQKLIVQWNLQHTYQTIYTSVNLNAAFFFVKDSNYNLTYFIL